MKAKNLVCDVCGAKCATPASLGSHKRVHKPKAPKLSLQAVLDKLAERLNAGGYCCPSCGGHLELATDGPGIYKLRCPSCYEGG